MVGSGRALIDETRGKRCPHRQTERVVTKPRKVQNSSTAPQPVPAMARASILALLLLALVAFARGTSRGPRFGWKKRSSIPISSSSLAHPFPLIPGAQPVSGLGGTINDFDAAIQKAKNEEAPRDKGGRQLPRLNNDAHSWSGKLPGSATAGGNTTGAPAPSSGQQLREQQQSGRRLMAQPCLFNGARHRLRVRPDALNGDGTCTAMVTPQCMCPHPTKSGSKCSHLIEAPLTSLAQPTGFFDLCPFSNSPGAGFGTQCCTKGGAFLRCRRDPCCLLVSLKRVVTAHTRSGSLIQSNSLCIPNSLSCICGFNF